MRLIDADALKKNRRGYSAFLDKLTGYWPCVLLAEIGEAPTIDAVPVVRCKDCKHRRNDEDYVCGHYCVKRPSNGGYFCEDDDFCSYGERRERHNESS